jgi:signal transduction histidine kinase
LDDKPILLLQAKTPRKISELGQQTLSGAMLLLAAATVIVSLVIWLLLRNMIVRPLEMISAHISSIQDSGDLSQRLNMSRSDEIGAVGRNFDEMAGELNDARQLLLEQSFKAGKADTAAEVMHNIRNAMTPLINGIDRLGVVFKVTDNLKVEQATQQIADPECAPDRKGKLLQYVDSAFKHIEDSHAEGRDELHAVSKQARLVEDIISDQDRHAHSEPVIESLELDDMLGEAVLVIPQRSSPAVRVNLQEKLGEYRVQGHRVGLLQVLGNVILNAYESIVRSESGSGSISLSAASETIDNQEMIRLVISDTGCGFDDESKNKIFQRGFTSKSGDQSGLGLHWCANAIAAMGGRIQAESTGAGQGAEFHLLLPAAHGG